MKIRLVPAGSKHLLVAIFVIFLATPIQVQSDQIAQGAVGPVAYPSGFGDIGGGPTLLGTSDI
jgi:hypothetical protein